MSIQQVKTIDDFDDLNQILTKIPEIEEFTPVSKEIGLISKKNEDGELEIDWGIPIIGAYTEKYIKIFKKIELIEGKFPEKNEKGLLVSKKFIDIMPKRHKEQFKIGNILKVSSFTKTGSISIMDIKIIGIIDIEGSDFSVTSNILDFDTFQMLVGYHPSASLMTLEQKKALEKYEKYLSSYDEKETDNIAEDANNTGNWENETFEQDDDWGNDNWENDEFGSDEFSIITDDIVERDAIGDELITKKIESEIDEKDLENLGTGKTDYIILRVKNFSNINRVVYKLNKLFMDKDLNYKAVNYIQSSGSLGAFISLIGVVISIVILIIQVISIIIIANSVLMGILERVNEIGTMRAIGAQKGYIFKLIFSESLMLSFFSAIVGTILSLIVIFIFGSIGIKAENAIAGILFGGRYLYPTTNIIYILISFFIVISATLLATIYPVKVGTKVSPLEAMNKI